MSALHKNLFVIHLASGLNKLRYSTGNRTQFRQPGIMALFGSGYQLSLPLLRDIFRYGKLTALCLPEP